jgi:hypothetical protein
MKNQFKCESSSYEMEIPMLQRYLEEAKVIFIKEMELEFCLYIIVEVLGIGLAHQLRLTIYFHVCE